jgi:hypothetical protein
MCQWFAPTKLMITFETEGKGKVTEEDLQDIAVRNQAGEVEYLKLPTKFVLVSNHQVRHLCPPITPFPQLCFVIRFMPTGGTRGV